MKPTNIQTTQNSNLLQKVQTEGTWYLEIPLINLKAPIKEGTKKQTQNESIQHFQESKKWIGNVCLAVHNKDYKNNSFANIKQLKKSDQIIYHYEGKEKEYMVQTNEIIQDTDLSCLENTEENTITIITYIENETNYRRCIKGIEIKKRKEEEFEKEKEKK